jgi:hypothetical protein
MRHPTRTVSESDHDHGRHGDPATFRKLLKGSEDPFRLVLPLAPARAHARRTQQEGEEDGGRKRGTRVHRCTHMHSRHSLHWCTHTQCQLMHTRTAARVTKAHVRTHHTHMHVHITCTCTLHARAQYGPAAATQSPAAAGPVPCAPRSTRRAASRRSGSGDSACAGSTGPWWHCAEAVYHVRVAGWPRL